MMSSAGEDGKTAGTSVLAARSRSASAKTASGRSRHEPRGAVPVLTAGPVAASDLASRRQRKALQAIRDCGQPEPENIESLANYMPSIKMYQVSLIFSGEAGSIMRELMTMLHVNNPNEVVKPAIALLLSTQGKEILLRDPKTGAVEMVEL